MVKTRRASGVKLARSALLARSPTWDAEQQLTGRFSFPLIFPQSYWIHDALSLWKTKPCFFCCEPSYDSLGWGGGLGPFVRNGATWGKNTFTCEDRTPQIYWISIGLRCFSWSSLLRCSLCHQKASIIDFEPCDLPFHEDAVSTFTS